MIVIKILCCCCANKFSGNYNGSVYHSAKLFNVFLVLRASSGRPKQLFMRRDQAWGMVELNANRKSASESEGGSGSL